MVEMGISFTRMFYTRVGDGISTKLNFTDSFASIHSVSTVHSEHGGKHSSRGNNRFNVNSELELKVWSLDYRLSVSCVRVCPVHYV